MKPETHLTLTLKDLKAGQMIELRWEHWNNVNEEFEPRTLHLLLIERSTEGRRVETNGWRAQVIYDSRPADRGPEIPYNNLYHDGWLKQSMRENKLIILSEPDPQK